MFTFENVKGYTRGASLRAIAATMDLQVLGTFSMYSKIPHVRLVAAKRVVSIRETEDRKFRVPAPRPVVGDVVRPVETAPVETIDFQALADKYGEPSAADVIALFAAKGAPELSAFCRSLAARRGARTRKAKAGADTSN
jgi:hypothetical protein